VDGGLIKTERVGERAFKAVVEKGGSVRVQKATRTERRVTKGRKKNVQVVVAPSDTNERLRKVLLLVGGQVGDGRDVTAV
jgi:hypothetical protein